MGFGILFFGYLLFLDFAYYTYTDAIAAVICWYALYKLSMVNRGFKLASYFSAAMTAFGIYELVLSVVDAVGMLGDMTLVYSVSASVRYTLIGILTLCMLIGMRDVANEVGLGVIAERCKRLGYTTVGVYALNILLEVGGLDRLIDITVIAYIAVLTIFATLVLISLNLSQIYACYAKICMPGQDDKKKRSKLGFVNAFRAHEEEKEKEYLDYRIEKLKKKAQRIQDKTKNGKDK